MFWYIVRRVIGAIPTLFAVITITFFLVHCTPGDPFSSERAMSPQALASLHHMYHMDFPMWQQYYIYLKDIVIHQDFGLSYKNVGLPINSILFPEAGTSGFWLSLKLGILVILTTIIFGMLLGIISGLKPNGFVDRIVSFFSVSLISIPTVVTAPIAIMIFAVQLGWLPPSQWQFDFSHLVMPVGVLSLPFIAMLAQIQRSSLIEVLNSPFIRTAHAKGLSMRKIVLKHALKPSLMPVISFLGPTSAAILTGTVVVEKVFGLPGMGMQMVNGAINRDYSMVLAITIIYSCLVILFNMIVDLLYGFIDPRARI